MPATLLSFRMSISFLRSAWCAAFALIIGSAPLAAQTGSINGRVTDRTSGEPVAQAVVTVSRSTGGAVASARSVANGSYVLTNLSPGTYTVSVRARIGLAPQHADSVVVRAGQTTTQDCSKAVEPQRPGTQCSISRM